MEYRLLFAEDARCTQTIVCSRLDKMHLHADVAGDGEKACEMAEKSKVDGHPYDMILMDMQMPKRNGLDATRWLREHGWEGPIVAVSVFTSIEDRDEFLDAGCNDYISKPVTEGKLRAVFARHLQAG